MRKGNALLTSKVDCESVKDFYQYYKERYFGYKGAADQIWPCMISLVDAPAAHHVIVMHWNPHSNKWNSADYDWEDFVQSPHFRFGYPNLGTVAFGPTYGYLAAFPRRESAKGLSFVKAALNIPQYEFIFTKYIAKEPQLRKMLCQGGYFGTPEEAELVLNVLNKKYYSWQEALGSLEVGERIGCQLNKHIGIYVDDKEEDLLLSFKDTNKFARVKPYLSTFRVELSGPHKHLAQLAAESLYQVNKDLIIA